MTLAHKAYELKPTAQLAYHVKRALTRAQPNMRRLSLQSRLAPRG